MSPALRAQLREAASKVLPPRVQDLTHEEKRRILRSVPCDQCGSPEGRGCVRPDGHSTDIHQARYAAVGMHGKGLIQW